MILLALLSVHWGLNLPQKHHPLLSGQAPLKSPNSPSPLFWHSPLSILFFCEPPLKVGLFSEPQKYYIFSSLTPSYLLKVTKFLVKISYFEILVITMKNIFAYKLFVIKYFKF